MIHQKWMRRRLRAYQDGSLDAGGARNLEAHLAQCAVCSGAVQAMLATDWLLHGARATPPALAPDDARLMFEVAVARSRIRSSQGGVFGRRLVGIAALVICGAVGLGIGHRNGPMKSARNVAPIAVGNTSPHAREASVDPDGVVAGVAAAPLSLPRTTLQLAGRTPPRRRSMRRLRIRPAEPQARAAPVASRDAKRTRQPRELREEGTLLLLMAEAPPSLVVTVTEAPAEAPGFAHAESTLFTAGGEQVFTQSTVSTCGVERAESQDIENEDPMQAPPAKPEGESDAH